MPVRSLEVYRASHVAPVTAPPQGTAGHPRRPGSRLPPPSAPVPVPDVPAYSAGSVRSCSTTRTDNPSIVWIQRERGLRLTRVRGVPLASEALRFIESGRRQRLCNSVASLDSAPSVLTGHS